VYCTQCKQEKDTKDFTLFKRNPALKSRKGHVVICRDCIASYLETRNNTKDALREVCQLLDIPYVETFAESASKQFIDKKKKKEKGIWTNHQTNIFNCYARYIGVINQNYINYSFSDSIRDEGMDSKIDKLEQLKQDLTPTDDKLEKEIKRCRNYLVKLFGEEVVSNEEKLVKIVKAKIAECEAYGDNNARQRKWTLKHQLKVLVENNVLNKNNFNFLFDEVKEEIKEEDKEENNHEKAKKKMLKEFNIDYLVEKWGFGYDIEEMVAFEKKYQLLKNNYPEQTSLHIEALQTYCRYRVKEEFATAKGLVKEAKDWGDLADKQAKSAKININQLSKSDLTMGLSTFGELVRMVEQSVDIIPMLPQFKEQPQDKPDFTLWCYINYVRDLKGLPPANYEDIYQFYEERKKENKERLEFLNTEVENEEELNEFEIEDGEENVRGLENKE
jgi:hypothetical protein